MILGSGEGAHHCYLIGFINCLNVREGCGVPHQDEAFKHRDEIVHRGECAARFDDIPQRNADFTGYRRFK